MSIKIENLYHIYSEGTSFKQVALENLSLEIPSGQFLGIAGHTGSGKSSLAQHLNGLLKPTKGRVIVDGLDLSQRDTKLKEVRRKVGLVFQYPEHQLFEETVFKDIAFGPLTMGLMDGELEKTVREAMKMVGLDYDYFKDLSPFQLSGGQMRRVAIAGVLALQPKYLVLDEPTAGLDPKGREEILALIKKLNLTKKITVILISHSMEDLARFANRVVIIEKGKIILEGPPAEVFLHSKRLKEAGLATPTITDLMYRLQEKGFDVSNKIVTLEEGVQEIKQIFGKKKLGEVSVDA